MFDLTGKTALVTGASGGIGEAVARALHAQGATVVLHGTRAGKLESLQLQLGDRAFSLAVDLSNRDQVAGVIEAATALAGQISILVNNAGITRDGLLMRMKDDDWDAVLEVNMTGNPGQTNYAASKAGMIGFSKSLAAEVASRGLTVNVVAPGFIETPMTDVLDEAQKAGLLSRVPAGRLGQADEIAAAVVFLASDEASYITGATLHVNGGMAML